MKLVALALRNAGTLSSAICARLGRLFEDRSARVRIVWIDVQDDV